MVVVSRKLTIFCDFQILSSSFELRLPLQPQLPVLTQPISSHLSSHLSFQVVTLTASLTQAPKMASDDDEALNTIIIGIDFGTTYSGVAFTWSKKIERMEVITSWEYQLHSTSDEEKTPTALSYDSNGNATWGYNIPLEAERAQWFKLLLIDETDLPEDVRGSKKIQQARDYLKKHKKTPIAVIAEYLRLLWNHCNQRILDTVGRALVNYSRFHIVITVPAIWPQYARARMREAAKEAGMITKRVGGETQLDIISEPEAAALATMADMDDRCDVKVSSQDLFIL